MKSAPRVLVLVAALLGLVFLPACAPTSDGAETAEAAGASETASHEGELEQLVTMMSGSFSSAAQAAEDERFFDIHLQIRRVWPEREDGYWLYVEQAAASSLDKPYRQRFYRVYETEPGWFVSAVYEMDEPLRFAGAHADLSLIGELTPEQLSIKAGCELALTLDDEEGAFVGETDWETCPSQLRGARFATSEVTISESRLESWDRGWDAAGEQVWGSEAGAYRFDKLESWPLSP